MEQIVIGVTGANGFIGSAFVEYFSKKNNKIHLFKGDLLKKKDLQNFFKRYKVTHIIHLAGRFEPPFKTLIQKNLLTTKNLLEIGTEYSLKKIIYASSGTVYGEPQQTFSSETDPLVPNTDYGLSKVFAEQIITAYERSHQLSYVILRFPNVFGEKDKKGVIHNFLSQAKSKKKIIVYGSGEQRRSFLHVSDACVAIEKAIYYKKSDIFNIAPKNHYSLLEIIKMLAKKYNFSIQYKPAESKVQNLILDTKKAEKILRFSAKKDIADFFTSQK